MGILLLTLSIASFGAWFWCVQRSPFARKLTCDKCNIIVISLSNLQRGHLDFYGYKRPTTPNLNQFFAHSVRMMDGLSPASLTYTDSLSLFYSLYPYTHKLMDREPIAPSTEVLQSYLDFPQILRRHGYYTAAFVSDEDYGYEYGLGKTFNLYFDRSFYPDFNILFKPWHYNIGTKDLVAPAVDWLRHNHTHRFFLFLQFYDLHCPYTPDPAFKIFDPDYRGKINDYNCYMTLKPAKKEIRNGQPVWLLGSWFSLISPHHPKVTVFTARDLYHLIAMYDGELREADSRLKELFDTVKELGLLKNTVIVFMSEHGDYLGENGYYMKAALTADGNLHNANIGFPFLMRLPHLHHTMVYKPPFALEDVVPTWLDILGIHDPARLKMQGKSLLKDLPAGLPAHQYVFSGSIRSRGKESYRLEAIQNREWKLTSQIDMNDPTKAPEFKLIHLSMDPNETVNLASKYPERVRQMDQLILKDRALYTEKK